MYCVFMYFYKHVPTKVKFDLWCFSLRFQSTHIPLRKLSRLKSWLKTLRFQSKFTHCYFNETYSTTSIAQIENITILKIVMFSIRVRARLFQWTIFDYTDLDWMHHVFNHDFLEAGLQFISIHYSTRNDVIVKHFCEKGWL